MSIHTDNPIKTTIKQDVEAIIISRIHTSPRCSIEYFEVLLQPLADS